MRAPISGVSGRNPLKALQGVFLLILWFRSFPSLSIHATAPPGSSTKDLRPSDFTFVCRLALLLFVGIPLPGTGAWTGTLGASILDAGFKKSSVAVMLGVILAGIIMGVLSLFIKGLFY